MSGLSARNFIQIAATGAARPLQRALAVEEPCAIEVNGFGYAVMMLTPLDLEDFAYGFALSERLIDGAADIEGVQVHRSKAGHLLRVFTRSALAERVLARVRHRISDSSCGLCGIENLEQALRPLPLLPARAVPVDPEAVFRALAAMREHQPLNRATGAVHGAIAFSAAGAALLAREDVGRHNAFDKLIGASLRAGLGLGEGFVVLSSRCSYELVEKAALAGCRTLVTISAATTLAVRRAREANLELISLARADAILVPD